MIDYRDRWALITGASSGIGEAFARDLAGRGTHLILAARNEGKLRQLADELAAARGITVDVIPTDLAKADAPQALYDEVLRRDRPVSILISNAGFGIYGKLNETRLEDNQRLIRVNILALMSLTRLFLPEMLAAKNGYIIHVASMAGFLPIAYMSTYAASKAFVLSFSEALWAECRAQGVRVLAVCPGATETPFFDVMGAHEPTRHKDTPQNVVKNALAALERGKSYVIPGRTKMNYILANGTRLAPRALVAFVAEKLLRSWKRT